MHQYCSVVFMQWSIWLSLASTMHQFYDIHAYDITTTWIHVGLPSVSYICIQFLHQSISSPFSGQSRPFPAQTMAILRLGRSFRSRMISDSNAMTNFDSFSPGFTVLATMVSQLSRSRYCKAAPSMSGWDGAITHANMKMGNEIGKELDTYVLTFTLVPT